VRQEEEKFTGENNGANKGGGTMENFQIARRPEKKGPNSQTE